MAKPNAMVLYILEIRTLCSKQLAISHIVFEHNYVELTSILLFKNYQF